MIDPTIDNTMPNTTFLSLSSLFSDGLFVGVPVVVVIIDVMVIVGICVGVVVIVWGGGGAQK